MRLWQVMMLQGIIPIVLVGILLPIGLVVLIRALTDVPVSEAVERGELFLAAANAAFTGCVVLMSSRPDQALNAAIASLLVLIVMVFPCYVLWALLTVGGVFDKNQAADVAVEGGVPAVGLAIFTALSFVWVSHRSPATASSALDQT